MSENPQETPVDQVRKVNLTRAAMYGFLSRAFKGEVDKLFLQSITEVLPMLSFLSNTQASDELKEANRLLAGFVEQVKKTPESEMEALITNLAAEYASLFLGVGSNPVHLAESVYLGKDHLLYEQPYHEVLQAYKSLGFEKEKEFTEPEDHVAVEFEFMANLCGWTSKNLDGGNVENAAAYLNLQKEFLEDHILRWVPELCKRLKGTTTMDFYQGLAQLTSAFIAFEDGIPDHLTAILKNKSKATK